MRAAHWMNVITPNNNRISPELFTLIYEACIIFGNCPDTNENMLSPLVRLGRRPEASVSNYASCSQSPSEPDLPAGGELTGAKLG